LLAPPVYGVATEADFIFLILFTYIAGDEKGKVFPVNNVQIGITGHVAL